MQRGGPLVFLLLSLLLSPSNALSADLAFSRNARTYETQESTATIKGMAHACLTATLLPDSLPCNPAFVPLNKKPGMGVQGLISNGYPTLDKMRKLLSGEVTNELVNDLFSNDRILQIEGSADIFFRSRYLNAKYTPLNAKYFSVVRNEANPDVNLFAVEEKSFLVQGGFPIWEGLSAGLQARTVERKFIKKQFKLIDLGTQSGRDLLKPIETTEFFVEPGLGYVSEHPWKFRASLLLANLGFSQDGSENRLGIHEEVQGGLGVSPPVSWGEWEIGLDYRSLSYEEPSATERLRFGSIYHFGAMYLTGGVDYDGVSGGVFYMLEQINAGITYSTTLVPWRSDDYYAHTVYVQFGWQN